MQMLKEKVLKLPDNSIKNISELQFKRALEMLNIVPDLIELGAYNTAINRAYYAVFHSMKAIEVFDEYDSKKHSGVISFFRKNYIKTGIFDFELSDIIKALQMQREDSDYNIIAEFNIDDAKDAYEKAKLFVTTVEKYLNEKIG